jgi:putative aldouronate transport system substrate-binding protein
MNTVKVNNIIEYGIEGTHYTVRNGVAFATPQQAELLARDRHDLGQLRTFNLNINPCMPRDRTQVQIDSDNAMEENNKRFVVGIENGLYSETFARSGAALQTEINDANAKYIMGQLDEAGWRAAVARWYSGGGDRICAEFTASYQKLLAARR